jgi:putative transposase
MKERFTQDQTVRILRETEVPGVQIREVRRKHDVTEQTFFRWRNKYGGLEVVHTRRLKDIEAESARLKKRGYRGPGLEASFGNDNGVGFGTLRGGLGWCGG